MAAATYETVLEMAESLAADERLRLVDELKSKVPATIPSEAPAPGKKHSIMELEGLGKEIWQGIDATEYVRELRAEWD
jgi:hypothetical protein